MSSEPPRKPPPKPLSKPPGLAPLDLAAIRNTTHSPTVILSPSSSSEMATAITPTMLTPIPSSSSISELATTPTTDDKRSTLSENLSLSPNGFFSSATVATGWITSRRVKGSATESPAPQNSPSSSYFPTLFRSRPRSESTELIEGNKRSGKKKETKEKMEAQSTILNFAEDISKVRDYPPGHRGFLEIHAEKVGFSERLRTILGINSFAEVSSLEQYSSEMVKLDLETKVLVSATGIIRIASKMKGEVHKKLLDSLRLYDRSMSYWLSQNDAAMNSYQHYMSNIFFEGEKSILILDFFYSIPEYGNLSNEIQKVLLPVLEKYKTVYKNLMDALEEYKVTFSLELSMSDLRHTISINHEAIAALKKRPLPMNLEDTVKLKALEDSVREMEREIQEKSEILSQSLRIIPKFTQDFPEDFPLESDFFNKFLYLRNKECDNDSRVADKKLENLPVWHKESLCEKNILKICLYFFRAICNQHPKFYDMWSGEKAHDIYINENFISKWSEIKNTEKFVHFMQQQKKYYNTGLLEIVLYKTLEYISENAQIPMNYSLIIKKALEKAKAKSSKPIGKPLQDYNEAFFKEAVRVAFKHIKQSSMVQGSESYLDSMPQKSGPAPRM